MPVNEASLSLAALYSSVVLDAHPLTHSPQTHVPPVSSSSTTSPPPPARPRFRDPPPTPAPIPPPPTRYALYKRALSATPPFSWFAKLDWRSGEQLEIGLVQVLTSHEENAVPKYRRVVLSSFRNRLVVEVAIAVGVLFAVLHVWTSNDFLVIMWLVIILSSIIVNQYLMMRRLIYILDHSEMHAGYVRELSARLNGGVYPDQPFLTANERRYSDDPLYLPEPPPVYNLATSIPPAYDSPPTQPKTEESGCVIQMSEYPRTSPPSRPLPPPAALIMPPGLAVSAKPPRTDANLSEAGDRPSRHLSSDHTNAPAVNAYAGSGDGTPSGYKSSRAMEPSTPHLQSLLRRQSSLPAPSSPTAHPFTVPLTDLTTTIISPNHNSTCIKDPDQGDTNQSAVANSTDSAAPILSTPSLSRTLSSGRVSNRSSHSTSFPYLSNSSLQGSLSIKTFPTSSQVTLAMPEEEIKNKGNDVEA